MSTTADDSADDSRHAFLENGGRSDPK